MIKEREPKNKKRPASEKNATQTEARKSRKPKKTAIEETLERTIQLNMQINAKIEEIAYWRALASKTEVFLGAISGCGMRKRSNLEECVNKIIVIEDSLKNDMDKLIEIKDQARTVIGKMDVPEYKTLLTYRYICGKTWEEVAEAMGYSYVHIVSRLHPKALEKLRVIETETEI